MKRRMITGIILATTTGLIIGGLTLKQTGASWDWDGINQQVKRHDEQLGNHEARITNVENDVADVQDNTATPPRSERVDVPDVVTQAAEPAPDPTPPPAEEPAPTPVPEPEPEPIVVTAYEQIPMNTGYNGEDMDCKLTYSDGTTYQWHWKTVEYNQTKITRTTNKCDDSVIGQPKP